MEHELEIWKDVQGYEGLYRVSSFGRVKALKKVRATGRNGKTIRTYPERILKPTCAGKSKYMLVHLCNHGKIEWFTVHSLVAKSHVANPNKLPVVNHIDTDKWNNRASNLEWSTPADNSMHAFENGLQPGAFGNVGVKNPTSKKLIDEATGKVYNSIVEAAPDSGFSVRSLRHQLSGTQIKKTTLKIAL